MGSTAQKIRVANRDYFLLPATEYRRYLRLVQPKNAGVDAIDFARQSIGRDLARKRHKAKLSQAQVAKRAKVRIETISRLESGRANPTAATVRKILRALGVES